jgi:hypothetical protein
MAVALGICFVQYAVEAVGSKVPSIAKVLLGQRAAGPVPLSFFIAAALALYFVIPVCYFALVIIVKRLLLRDITPQHAAQELENSLIWSRWLYTKLSDVPFFTMYLHLNVMSHLTKWNYQALGSHIGARTFLVAPYTAEPELLRIGDGGMVAGNVSLYGVDFSSQRAGPIRVGKSAVVTNSCVLQAGAELAESSLLGDLSVATHADVIPPHTIAVGSPPRVVGRANFCLDTVSIGRYVLNQSVLVLLQWVCLAAGNVIGFLLIGVCLRGLVSCSPLWVLWCALPGLCCFIDWSKSPWYLS